MIYDFATMPLTINAAATASATASAPITTWPAYMIEMARMNAQDLYPDDYELKMSDIEEGDQLRFRLERCGRSYAAHWPYDYEIDIWRNVYLSYPEDVLNGTIEPSHDHHSGIFWRDIKTARKDIDILCKAPEHLPLQRANAELGNN